VCCCVPRHIRSRLRFAVVTAVGQGRILIARAPFLPFDQHDACCGPGKLRRRTASFSETPRLGSGSSSWQFTISMPHRVSIPARSALARLVWRIFELRRNQGNLSRFSFAPAAGRCNPAMPRITTTPHTGRARRSSGRPRRPDSVLGCALRNLGKPRQILAVRLLCALWA